MFKRKDHLVGLDIGSSLIKVAELKPGGKTLSLNKFAVARLSPEAVVDGRINRPDEVAGVIRELFKTQKIKEKNVAISTGGYSVVVKTINVPTASEESLQESIRFEAEQYIPYDIDDVNIDFQILGTSQFSPDQMNVLLVAVKKDLVAEYIDLIDRAGLNPCIIDVDTFALQNIYETVAEKDSEEVVMLVDVGASKTSLNIMKGATSLMMRDNSSGTNQIRDELMAGLGCSIEEADKILLGAKTDLISPREFRETCLQVVQGWCGEIYSVVSAYQSKSSEGNVRKVIVCGGGSLVEGFTEHIGIEIAADVAVLNPFQAVQIDQNRFKTAFLEQVAPLASIALGLALRKVDDK